MVQATDRLVDVGDHGSLQADVLIGHGFNRGPDAVDYSAQIRRTKLLFLSKFPQRRLDRAAVAVAKYYDQFCSELRSSKLDATYLRWCDDVACDPNDKQVTQALVENHLDRYTRV